MALAAFSDHGRADWLPFIALRAWLLGLLGLAVVSWRPLEQVAAVALALVAATVAEAMAIALLGGRVGEGAPGLAAGLALGLILLGLFGFARWAGGRGWRWLGAMLCLGLLLAGAPRFERWALPPERDAPRAARPDLLLLSGLPLAWSEKGVAASLAGEPRPATVEALARGFTLRPIAAADPTMLAPARLLLAVQPRVDPAGLVALDDWVRGGGRALILADPDLRWPTDLPAGDPRRPPDAAPLLPLLAHWGLALDADAAAGAAPRLIDRGGARWRVRPGAPGRWRRTGGDCVLTAAGLVADCAVGRGRAVLLADADLLLDDLWVGVGLDGTGRRHRTADNGPLLVALLDGLRGAADPKARETVAWLESGRPMGRAATGLFLPPVLLILAGLAWRRGHARQKSLNKPNKLIHRRASSTKEEH